MRRGLRRTAQPNGGYPGDLAEATRSRAIAQDSTGRYQVWRTLDEARWRSIPSRSRNAQSATIRASPLGVVVTSETGAPLAVLRVLGGVLSTLRPGRKVGELLVDLVEIEAGRVEFGG
jgi:hypothetical protein